MSGSLIIDNDHRAWASARSQAAEVALPDEHPRVRQFAIAWQRVVTKGLDDGPGPAAARYHALAHAALALSTSIDRTSNPHEPEALDLIATHARKHSVRLRATADRLFSVSRQAGRYQGGRAQAETGSRMIEKDYRAWIRTGSPLAAARDPLLWQHARRAEKAWHAVRRHGVADGPAAAAARYCELADAAQALADLTEISSQIEAAVVSEAGGKVLASTVADEASAVVSDADGQAACARAGAAATRIAATRATARTRGAIAMRMSAA